MDELTLETLERRVATLERPLAVDGMTLGQFEALAARLGAAAQTIRDAQALLGRPPPPSEPQRDGGPEDAALAHRIRQLQAPPPVPGRPHLSPAEASTRRELMAQFSPDPALPDDIQAMERDS